MSSFGDPVPTGEDLESPPRFDRYYLFLDPVFEERAACGMYDELADQLSSMGIKALGNVDCPDDFVRYQPPHSTNIEFRDNAGAEFRTLIVGEVAGSIHGTVLLARYRNYFTGNFKPIDDTKLNVKDILALTMPTCATTRLANFYENQTVPLRAAIDHEIGIESDNPAQEFLMRPWLRAIEDDSTQDDIIMCHMLPKYGIPAAAGAATPQRRGKRKLDDTSGRGSSVATPGRSTSSIPGDVREPQRQCFSCLRCRVQLTSCVLAHEIRLGALYDPRLLSDYGGAYFNQTKARLVQLDVRDGTENGKNALVPPFNFYDRLRPGTLVLISASLHIFVMNDTDANGVPRPRKRKIYQINAHSIKILADSDAPIEGRSVMVPRNFDGPIIRAPPPPEFDNFRLTSSPTKAGAAAVAGPSTLGSPFDSQRSGALRFVYVLQSLPSLTLLQFPPRVYYE
ncbi:hypothetical protein C8R43DRAFT_896332 [Mycena crocata]|nr:hypothetical protein C8R43DRAFT_896332 [Mycena crocata]